MSTKRNTAYNLAGTAIPVAISLITVPAYISVIGEERYGVLAIAWLILGYLGFLDLGLGRATAQSIATSNKSAKEIAEIFWTALSLSILLGCTASLLIWPATSYFFSDLLKIEKNLHHEILESAPYLILALPLTMASGVLSGALQGSERFRELSIITTFGALLFQSAPLLSAIYWGADMRIIMPTVILSRAVALLALFLSCRKHVLKSENFVFSRTRMTHLFRFGGWITISSLLEMAMVMCDRFIISAISGAKEVSYYSVPFQLGERSLILSRAICSSIFPRLARGNKSDSMFLVEKSFRFLISSTTPLIAIGIIFLEPFLGLWISEAFAEKSAVAGQILLFGFWLNGCNLIPQTMLQAQGKPKTISKYNLVTTIPYFIMIYLLVSFHGISGAALAFTIKQLTDLIIMNYLASLLKNLIGWLWGALASLSAIILSTMCDASGTLTFTFLITLMAWCLYSAPNSSLSAPNFFKRKKNNVD